MKQLLFLIIFFSLVIVNAQTVVDFTTPGTQIWVCPANVSQITVQCWGGGGGGGNSASNTINGGSGGGGGAYSNKILTVTPGTTYYLNVGQGGSGAPGNSTAQASNGGDSWLNTTNSNPINNSFPLAKGGLKGLNNSATIPLNGGPSSQSYGDIVFFGGNGYAAYSSGGGGGGASGTSQGPGIPATSINGAISNGFGGNGGNASTSSSVNGQPGLQPGGGGGGSDDFPSRSGGNGGNGQVRISYFSNCAGTPTTPVISSNSTSGCGGLTLWTTGYANTPGLVFQWQSANTVNGPWSNILNSNDSLIIYNTYSDTYFRLQITCLFGGQTVTSNTVYYDFISNQNLVQPTAQNLTVNCGQNLLLSTNGTGNGFIWSSFLQDTTITSVNQLQLNAVNNDTTIYVQTYINPPVYSDTITISQASQLINFTNTSCGNGNIQGSGNIGFNWTDATPFGNTITSFKILLNVGVECNPGGKNIQINQMTTSNLTTTSNCSCLGGNQYLLTFPTTALVQGGLNQFRILNANNLGLFNGIPNYSGYYAKVVVSYTTNQQCVSQQSPIVITSVTPNSAGVVSSSHSICSGQAPQLLNFTGLQGTIVWQQSSDSLVWTDIVGANSNTLNITANLGALTTTKWFRVKLSNAGCTTIYSNNVKVTVNPLPNIVASNDVILCAGLSANLTVTGGTSYSWSPSAGLNNTTSSTVIASPSNTTTYVVIGIDQNGCTSQDMVGVTILPVAQGGSIGPQASYCTGTVPLNMTISGQQGTIQWQYSYDNTNWNNYVGSTGTTLFGSTIGALTQTTYIRAVTNLNNCGAAYSNIVPLTVFQPTIAGTVTSNQSICSGSLPSQLVVAGYVGSSFQWQYSTNNSTWNNISGATNDTLSTSQMAFLGFGQNYYFRVRVNNGPCTIQNTNSVLITVVSPPSPGNPTAPQTICFGASTPNISSTGTSGSLQWEQSTTSNGPWNAIAGATSSTLTGTQIGSLTQTTYFRLASSNPTCGIVYSIVTSVIVNPIAIAGTASSNQNVCTGTSPLPLNLTGFTGTIQWQVSTNNSTWSNISGATSSTLSSAQMGSLTSIRYYRAIVSSGSCTSATSNTIMITIVQNPSVGTVTAAQTICSGTVPTSLFVGSTTGTINWQYSLDNISYSTIPNSNNNTLLGATIGSLTASTYYRVEATNSPCPSAISNNILITVIPAANPGTISANQTICTGTQPAALVSSGSNGSLQWEVSTNNSTWTIISGATSSTLSSAQMGSLTATRYYRLVASSCSGASVNISTPITITVSTTSSVGSITPNQNVCSGNLPSSVNLSSFNGSIQWQIASSIGGPFLPIGNGTNPLTGSQIGPITSNKYIRASVTNQSCPSVLSNVHNITVLSLPIVNAGVDQTVCSGDSISLFGSGSPNLTFTWSNGVQNGQYFVPNSSTTFTVTGTTSQGCVNTDNVNVVVLMLPQISMVASTPTTICQNEEVMLNCSSVSTVEFQWYYNNQPINGATQNSIQVNQQGIYYASAESTSTGCVNYSNSIFVTVLPSPQITFYGDSIICDGDMATITADSDGNVTWNGTLNQNVLQASPSVTTDYNVVSQGTNGCSSSATLTIEVHYAEDTTIFMSSYGPLVMAGQTFSQSGVYTLDLNSAYGCDSTVTLNLNVLFNDIETIETSDVTLINPVKNGLVHILSEDIEVIKFNGIYDILGREISYETIVENNGGITIQISVPIGAYYINLEQEGKLIQKKFIVVD